MVQTMTYLYKHGFFFSLFHFTHYHLVVSSGLLLIKQLLVND